jgi:putative transposase
MLRATKVRVYPTPEQAEFLNRQFGAVRFVWNKALAIKRHRYRVHGDKLSAKHDLKPLLAVAKHSRKYAWLAGFDGHSLQQACINLDRAFTNFFEGRARFPRFKRKHGSQSSYHCTGKIKVGADWITIPKPRAVSLPSSTASRWASSTRSRCRGRQPANTSRLSSLTTASRRQSCLP